MSNSAAATASPQTRNMPSRPLPGTDVPGDFTQMMELAKILANADIGVPSRLQGNPANVMAYMIRARALDIPLAVAWDQLFTPPGTRELRPRAHLVHALARRAGNRFTNVRVTKSEARADLLCPGEEPHPVSFTIAEANAKGYTDPDGNDSEGFWERDPDVMLHHRLVTRGVGRYCPEVMLGMGPTDTTEGASAADAADVADARDTRQETTATILREAEALEDEQDGLHRVVQLRKLIHRATDLMDEPTDATGKDTVRGVLTAKLKAAQLHAAKEATTEAPAPRKRAPKKAPALRKRAATKKTAKEPSAGTEDQKTVTPEPGAPEGANRRADDARLPCGCLVDAVISSGAHADACVSAP